MELISGGHYDFKGYYYCIYLTFPTFNSTKTASIMGNKDPVSVKRFSANTGFDLISNSGHVNILGQLLGFGLGIVIYINKEV